MSVDPANPLVAAQLELEWNATLAELREAGQDYEQQRRADRLTLGEEQKAQVVALATDFPRLWNDPRTAPRDRKRLIRMLIEDVTLLKSTEITAHVRFQGGAVRARTLPRPLPDAWVHRSPTMAAPPEAPRPSEVSPGPLGLLDNHGFGLAKPLQSETTEFPPQPALPLPPERSAR